MIENKKREQNVLTPELLQQSKVILLVRHGEVDVSPEDKIYNRDEHMSGNIVHLSNKGRGGLLTLGKEIVQVGLKPRILWVSPQTRAVESANVLNVTLELDEVNIHKIPDINELDFPNAYMAGVQMKDLQQLFEDYDWMDGIMSIYPAEKYDALSERMLRAFQAIKSQLSIGESGILLSHGDPLACLANKLLYPDVEIESPTQLRNSWYVPKGNALVVAVDSADSISYFNYLLPVDTTKIY